MSKLKQNWDKLVDDDGNYYNPNIGGGGGGTPGGKGEKGEPGAPKGEKGEIGATGATGATGAAGAAGATGPAGAKGDKGSDGLKGAPGGAASKGDVGPKGEVGAAGPAGPQGPQGEKGVIGAKGELGSKGEVGEKGPQGVKGQQGPKGEVGEKGIKGSLNDKGQKGDDGTAAALLTYQGNVADKGSLPGGAAKGDTYFVEDGGQVYYSWDGTAWVSAGQAVKGDIGVQGVKGETGQPGTDGIDGNVGPKGEVGLQGIKGEQGQKGEQNAKGEPGLTGAKGNTGAKGDQPIKGQKGDDGTAAALLTYQGNVADKGSLPGGAAKGDTYFVEDGLQIYYSWDGAAWVSAGQAVKGDIGVTGAKGATGAKGEVGEKGATGVKGFGDKGDQGIQGVVGAKGDVGAKGEPSQVKGAKGEEGAAAALLRFQGSVATKGDLDPLKGTAAKGDTYLVNDASQIYYSYDGNSWVASGQAIKGNQGDKGIKGDFTKGDKGEKGFKGEEVKGDKGRQGFRGVKGDLVAGAVTAHVTFNGETSTANGGTLSPADIYSSHEVSSVERVGTGHFRINFASPFKRPVTQAELNAGQYTDTDGNTVAIPTPPAGTTLPDPLYTWHTDYWVDDGYSYTVVGSCGGRDFSGIGASNRSLNVLELNANYVEILTEQGNGGQDNTPLVTVACYGTGTPGYTITAKGEPGTGVGSPGDKGQKGEEGEKGVKGNKGLIPAGAASAHAAFDGSTAGSFDFATDTRASYNVSNITRQNVGTYTITWDTAFASDAYTVMASAGAGDHGAFAPCVSILDQQAGYVQVLVERGDNGDAVDEGYISVIAYGPGDSGIYSTIKGDKGIQGPATIAIDSTTTVEYPNNATVTNVGTLEDHRLAFEIPRGEKGDRQFQAAGAVTAHATFVATAGLANGVLGAGDIKSSFGISQIEKIRDGEFTVTFTNPFTGADNYSAVGSAHGDYGAAIGGSTRVVVFNTFTANSVLVEIEESNGDRGSADTVSVVFYGDSSTGEKLDYKGDKGEKGPTGGEKGQKGEQSTEVGPQGPLGDKGEKGVPGTAVAKGDKGNKGIDGDDGIGAGVTLKFAAFDASAGPSFNWSADKLDSYGISSVNRIQAGRFEVFFSGNFSNANYAFWGYTYTTGDSQDGSVNILSRNSGSCIVEMVNRSNTVEDSNEYICLQFMGT